MTDYAIYFQEVLDAHQAIEDWFGGHAGAGAEAALLACFSPAFSMVSPQGRQLDKAALAELFRQGEGRRPGFAIRVDALQGIALHAHGATVAYREEQTNADGQRTVRLSTVVFELTTAGRPLWRHLHECWAA